MTLKIMCTYVHDVTLGSRCKMACWTSYWFLPFTAFSLGLPFCFSSYIIHLRCTSGGGGVVSMFNEPAHSFFVWGSLWASVALLCCHSAKWVVSCTRIMCIQPLSCCSLTCLASSFFSESVFLSFPLLFHHAFFLVSGVLAISCRTHLLACLIRASILHFSFCLHLFTSRCFVIGSLD